jgi:ubiquinone biosynthesis protein UbiJ
MSEGVIIAVITGICSVLGVILSNAYANKKVQGKIETAQAVTDTKIEELTREVREHNNFAKRVPVLEKQVDALEKRLDKGA